MARVRAQGVAQSLEMIRWTGMWDKLKIPLATAATLISTVASVLKILEWFGFTHTNFGTWPRWLDISLTVLIFGFAVVGGTFLWRTWSAHRIAAKKKERAAFAVHTLLDKFSGWAKELRDQLETIWHACNDTNVKLPFPLATNLSVVPEHNIELRRQIDEFRFRVSYYQHLFESVFPHADYSLRDCGPSATIEYIRLLRMFEDHLEEIRKGKWALVNLPVDNFPHSS